MFRELFTLLYNAEHIESYCHIKWQNLGQMYLNWNLRFYHNEREEKVNGFDSHFVRVKLL